MEIVQNQSLEGQQTHSENPVSQETWTMNV